MLKKELATVRLVLTTALLYPPLKDFYESEELRKGQRQKVWRWRGIKEGMEPTTYDKLTDEQLIALCVFREARGEGPVGKRCVACVIKNRANKPSWWGRTVREVILHPYQFSSFNSTDANATKWPEDNSPSWLDSIDAVRDVFDGSFGDITKGATFYWSAPLTAAPERAWGEVVETLHVGRLHFCRPVSSLAEEIT